MWNIFALSNLYFALNVFAALVFLSVAWLYFDAYKELHSKRELWKVAGFIIIAISFLFRGLDLQAVLPTEISYLQTVFRGMDLYARILGYSVLVFGLLIDPLQDKPKLSAFILMATPTLLFLSPTLAAFVAVLFLRRASIGLERHLYPPSIAFFFLAFYELLFSSSLFRETTNLSLFSLVDIFGPLWITQLVVLTIGIGFLARWVFRYLLKQFESQLFMITMGLVLTIYLIVTVGFTGLLINNLKGQILNELKSEANVLSFALNAKKSELLSYARLVASLGPLNIPENVKYDSLVFFDTNGIVTYRGEDTERKGDSMSGDKLVRKVLDGKDGVDVVVKDGVVAPTVMVISGTPVLENGKVVGGVMVGQLVDSAFLSGFEKLTGLKAAVYGGDTLSAGGTIGAKESNQKIKDKVLKNGEVYALESRWLNVSFLSVYSPLKDVEGNPVGMTFVGRPQVDVLLLASNTLEIIFLGTILLLLLSMIPAKMISKSISKQIK